MKASLTEKLISDLEEIVGLLGPLSPRAELAVHPITERLLLLEDRQRSRDGHSFMALDGGVQVSRTLFGFRLFIDQTVAVNAVCVRGS